MTLIIVISFVRVIIQVVFFLLYYHSLPSIIKTKADSEICEAAISGFVVYNLF